MKRATKLDEPACCYVCRTVIATGELGVNAYSNWCHLRCFGEVPDVELDAQERERESDRRARKDVSGRSGHLR
jgi:hypothetical protein